MAVEAPRPHLAPAPGSPASFLDPNGWRTDALCRGVDTELFFPAGELGEEPVQQAEAAKRVCAECPVREACLEYTLATDQPFGVWGGTTEAKRRSIRRRRRRRAVASLTHPSETVAPPCEAASWNDHSWIPSSSSAAKTLGADRTRPIRDGGDPTPAFCTHRSTPPPSSVVTRGPADWSL